MPSSKKEKAEKAEMEAFYKTIGYKFNNSEWLMEAVYMGAPAALEGRFLAESNKPLAHLGHAVLVLLITTAVYNSNRADDTKRLGTMISTITGTSNCSLLVKRLRLEKCANMGAQEDSDEEEEKPSDVQLMWMLKAIIGAVWKDSGFSLDAVGKCVLELEMFDPWILTHGRANGVNKWYFAEHPDGF